ncbi:MAG TPA: ABC transporter permease [Candidatus Deferrimicrobiaceae bacterium]|jgi:NitT/TauT family transport system permease protein
MDRNIVKFPWEPALLFIAILAAWQLVTTLTPVGANPLYPTPVKTLEALRASLPELWKGTVSSFLILVPGYLLAVAAGIFSGLIVGESARMRKTFFPFARVVAPVPPTVYVAYAIAILPTFRLSAMFVIFLGAFWPVFLNTAAGVHSIDVRYRDNARILGLSRREYLLRVAFPAALPHIFSGMAVGLALSFIMLTVAELFGANAGLGRFVQYYADFADYPKMAAGILYTGCVTWASMALLESIRKRALFWLLREDRS